MIYDLIDSKDQILHQESEKFDFSNPPIDPVELAKNLTETMLAKNGIGLSACQVGIPYSVFVVYSDPILCLFNPKIVDISQETITLEEGCLSYPDLLVKVKRPKSIKIRYTQPNGQILTEKYTGMTARVMLHEYAHLQGRTMLDDASTLHKEQAIKRMKKLRRGNKNEIQFK